MESPLKTTPTKKRRRSDQSLSPRSSPKFMKPSELFRRRLQQGNIKKQHHSPSKATAALRRCKLPIETVEKIYSPLKCLQLKSQQQSGALHQQQQSIQTSKSPKAKALSFSPLMKKLQRSPGRSQISFPVVKRCLHQSFAMRTAKNTFTRVLDFNEDAQTSFPSSGTFLHHQQQKQTAASDFYPLNSPQIDWSLKTRIKIVVNRSIPFHGSFNSVDEANGLNQFVRGCLHQQQQSIDNDNIDTTKSCQPESNFCCELQRHCLVWQHPHLSWMHLFPRQPELKPGTQVSSMKPPIFQISPTGSIADSLHSDFCLALHSLFKLLKTKYCPYFYVCANNFTVLFRASGVANSNEAHALITPTTIGFRRLLETEAISFEMPFHHLNSSSPSSGNQDDHSKTSTSSSGIETDLEDIHDDDDDDEKDEESSNLWLESLGLSQQDFPSLETSSLRRRRLMTTNVGATPQATNAHHNRKRIEDQSAQGKVRSLIRVNGIGQLQALLGLFINQRKICISTSGALAGIPPTILAPVAFHGACLRPISVRHKTTGMMTATNSNPTITTLDFNGPLLPHAIYGLTQLLTRLFSQQENSITKITVIRSTLRTFDPSASFALESGLRMMLKEQNSIDQDQCNPTFSVENLNDSGMDREFLMAICAADRQFGQPVGDLELLAQGIRYNRLLSAAAAQQSMRTKPLLSTANQME